MIKLETNELAHIQQFLIDDFSFSELKDIAFDMGLDCENFPLDSKIAFSGAMLTYVQQYDNLSCLLAYMEKRRANQEIARLLNHLPSCQPRKKVELVLRDLNMRGLDRTQLKGALAHLLNLKVEEVGVLSIAPVGTIFLISLPRKAAAKLAHSNVSELIIEGQQVEAINDFDTLSSFEKTQWYKTTCSNRDAPQLSENIQRVVEQATQPMQVERSAQLLQSGRGKAAMKRLLGVPISKPGIALLWLTLLVVLIGAIVFLAINLLNSEQPPDATPTEPATVTLNATTEATTPPVTTPPITTPPVTTPPTVTTPTSPETKPTANLAIEPLPDRNFGIPPFAVPVKSNSDASLQFSVSGSCSISPDGIITIRGVGDCTVVVRQAEAAGYGAAEVSQTFTVSKATATLTLKNLSQRYDGKPKDVTYTIEPNLPDARLIITYTYNDKQVDRPVNAGSYAVSATINHANYQASTTGTLVVQPATATLAFEKADLNSIYDGKAKTVRITTTPANLSTVSVSYSQNGQPIRSGINAGVYGITATLSNNNYTAAPITANLVIQRASATLTFVRSDLNQTYDGKGKSVRVTTIPADLTVVTVTYAAPARLNPVYGEALPVNANNYAVRATLSNNNYTAIPVAATLIINKAPTTVTLNDFPAHPLDWTTTPPALKNSVKIQYYSVVGTKETLLPGPPTGEGEFKVRAVLAASQNYLESSDEITYFRVN